MIEINAWHLTALILATVFLTSMIWLGVAVILAGRAVKADEDAAFDKGWEAAKRDYGYYDKLGGADD